MNREKMLFIITCLSSAFAIILFFYALTFIIPLPVIILGGIIVGAVAGWFYDGRSGDNQDTYEYWTGNSEQNRRKHPADYMSEEEKQRMYEEWINKK